MSRRSSGRKRIARLSVLLVSAAALALGAAPASASTDTPGAAAASKIQHIVILMQENRSFDDYFGRLHFEGQNGTNPEPRGANNPNPVNSDAPPIKAFHQTSFCEVADLNHSWTGVHQEIDGGLMDGFTAANVDPADPLGARAMGFYDSADLPFYYGLYSTFAIGDRFFASVPGPTFPNREYLLAGTSFGHIQNDLPAAGLPGPSIFNELDAAGITWKDYFSDLPSSFLFAYARLHAAGHLAPIAAYYADAAAGTLPQVAFVDPKFTGTNNTETDEHPPVNIQVGQRFVSGVVQALFASPVWSSSALFLTYDEHGGYYDQVAPPAAVAPDDIAPMLGPGDVQAGFDMYGVRVPAVVVSPFSRAHFVSHIVHDHTSILRFVELRFGLPAMTRRDAAADPMLELFDFSTASFATAPSLPAATIDPTKAAACAA